jgi:hypothetical protein
LTIFHDAGAALDLSARILSLAVIHDGLQTLISAPETGPGGLLDWRLTARRRHRRWDALFWRLSPDSAPYPSLVRTLALAQVTLGAAGLLAPRSWYLFALMLIVEVLLQPVLRPGLDGADEMLRIVIVVCALRALDQDSKVQIAAAAFLGAQTALAYLTSGLSKTQSKVWWDSTGLRGVTATEYFGTPGAARLLDGHRRIARLLSLTIMAWEALFALALLAPGEVLLAALAVGLLFHLSCGFGMGLDGFLLPFASTYPAALILNNWLGTHLSAASRTGIVGLAACGIVGFACFSLGTQRVRPNGPARRSDS